MCAYPHDTTAKTDKIPVAGAGPVVYRACTGMVHRRTGVVHGGTGHPLTRRELGSNRRICTLCVPGGVVTVPRRSMSMAVSGRATREGGCPHPQPLPLAWERGGRRRGWPLAHLQ